MSNWQFKKVLTQYNYFLIFKQDHPVNDNAYPKSLLSWKSTRDLDYLKFMVSKSMIITNTGIQSMLTNIHNQYQKMVDEYNNPEVPVKRGRGRPRKNMP